MRLTLPAIGQSYRHTDLPLSAQVTKNWVPEINTETSRVVTLQPFPGARLFSVGSGKDRGATEWDSTLYMVAGTTLYSVDANGVRTSIGSINGAGRCTFPASQEYLVIVTSGLAYLYDGSTLTEISDVDLEAPDYGAYLNNQWIYQGTGGRFAVSDAGQPDQINALNYATAESDGDLLQRPYTYQQLVYMFGSKTIEPWYNSGEGNPPFNRVEGGIIQKGTLSPDAISHNDNYMYFLGDDRHIYQMLGTQERSISTIPLVQAFEGYTETDIAEAVGFCYSMRGQHYYQLRVGSHVWAFNESAGGWFELTVGNNEDPYPATGYIYKFGKHLFFDQGNILELDPAYGLFNGLPMIRERITSLITGAVFGDAGDGKYVFMREAEILIKGVPPLGDAPQIMLSWSDDAGYTWSNERIIECGQTGNYTFRARAHNLGRFRERVFKIRISDESSYSIHKMIGDMRLGT